MKPIPQNTPHHDPQGDQRPGSEHSHFPTTDYAFQTTTLETVVRSPRLTDKAVAEARTFRNIGRHFIEVGAGREYMAEAFVFVCIAIAAAGPLSVLVRELTSMMITYK